MSLRQNQRPSRAPSERALDVYHRCVVLGQRPAAVARELSLSRRRVLTLRRGVERWLNGPCPAIDAAALRMTHHLILTRLVRESLDAWERSKKPGRVTKARLVQGRTDKHGAPQSVATSEQIDREECGNPRFLQVCNDLLKSIRSIWGAETSKQAASPTNARLSLATLLSGLPEYLSTLAAAVADPPANVFDADAAIAQMLALPEDSSFKPPRSSANRRKKKES